MHILTERIASGIQKVYGLRLKEDGILAKTLSCTACSPMNFTYECKDVPYSVILPYKQEEEPAPPAFYDDGTGRSDSGDENLAPGEVVWTKYGKPLYPARIISR